MKKLPETATDWSALNDLIAGGLRRKIFVAALDLKIFDHLAWNTAGEVAAALSSHPRNTELLLNALAGMGLVQKREGRYAPAPLSAEFLTTASPTYLGDYLLHVDTFHEQFPGTVEDLVRHGPPPAVPALGDEALWAASARRSAAYQYGGEAQGVADLVRRLPEFPGMISMLDLGGGSGFYAMAMISAHPSLRGVVWEQPAVAAVARDFIRSYGMENRVSVVAGDYAEDPLGGPYDLIFASATLNFHKRRFDELFRRIHDALSPGGIFMTHQDGVTEERTKPALRITEFLIPEMMGADFAIAQGEIADAMLRAGFASVRGFTKRSSLGEMDVEIGRKGRKGVLQ